MTPVQLPEVPAPNWCRTCGRSRTDPNAVLCLDPCHRHSPNRSRTVGADILEKLEREADAGWSTGYSALFREAAAEIGRLRGEVCSCPSGDGSLRWPCKAHPPEAIAPAEAKGDALLHIARLRGISNHIKACPAYENLRGDADCIDSAIDFILTNTPQPADGGAVAEWQVFHPQDGWGATHRDNVEAYRARGIPVRPLYTHPPAAQVQQEAVDREAWAEALELPDGYEVEEFLPGGWHYAWTRADGERMVSGTTWNHPALAAIAAWQYAPATHPTGDALGAVRDAAKSMRELAKTIRQHGTCAPAALEYVAGQLDKALQHRGDSRGGEE